MGVLFGEARNRQFQIRHLGWLARRIPEQTWYTFLQVIQLQLQKSPLLIHLLWSTRLPVCSSNAGCMQGARGWWGALLVIRFELDLDDLIYAYQWAVFGSV